MAGRPTWPPLFHTVRPEDKEIVPIGMPIDNCHVVLLDSNMHPVPVGVPGEIYVGGSCVGLGYLNDPVLTRAKFVPNPFPELSGETLYRTGDRGKYNLDGHLEFLGRLDTQVKLNGIRIELGEIETAIREHEDVRDAIVVLQSTSADAKVLVAHIISDLRSSDLEGELRRFLPSLLADYMVPDAFVPLKNIPYTSSGKVNRRALPKWTVEAHSDGDEGIETATTLVEVVSRIWSEILHLNEIRPEENFFDLGGRSLLLTAVHERLDRRVGEEDR